MSVRFSAEDCSLDPKNPLLPKGLHDGDQIRVYRHDNKDFVLFTVRFKDEGEFAREKIRMTVVGMSRLGYEVAEDQKLNFHCLLFWKILLEKKPKILENYTNSLSTRQRS